ncbi:TonB-dependent receptor [Desulfatiferula olefinivorans]
MVKKMKYLVISFLVSGCVTAWTGPAFSKDETMRDDVYSLGEIVVLGNESEVAADSTVYEISAQEISDMGATTLTDVLERVPGVSIRVGGQGTPRVDIRGFKTRHVVLLLNGVPINDTYDGQFDPSVFPVEQIAEVKVITGGGSVLYGSNGNGGIINIITKKGAKGVHGTAGAEYGTEDAWLARASLSAGSDKASVFVSANHEEQDAYPLSDDFSPTAEEDGDKRENSDFKRDSLFAILEYSASDNTHLGLTLNWYNGENGVPPAIERDPASDFNKNAKYDRVDDTEGYAAQLAFSHRFDTLFGLKGWIYRNQQEITDSRYDDDTYTTADSRRGSSRIETATAITGINTQVSCDHGDWIKTTLGLIYEDHSWEADGYRMTSNTVMGDVDSNEDIHISSVALEWEVSPNDAYGVLLGVAQHFMNGSGVSSDNDTSYVLGGHVDVTETTRLRASHARKVRFPSMKQLYDETDGNSDLKTEMSIHYEIGLEQKLPARSVLSVSTYYTDVEDYIEKLAGPYENLEEYRFQGIDVSLETGVIDNLLVRLSYSLMDTKDKSLNTERDELQYRPGNKYALDVTYAFPFGLKVHTDVIHMADQYYYAEGTSPMPKAKLNDYTVVNAKISQSLLDGMVDVYVRGENLFDEDYEQSYDLPQAGLTVYGGVAVRF